MRATNLNHLTMSPFLFFGGSQETITLAFEAGIALMSCGADGTALYRSEFQSQIYIRKSSAYHLRVCDRKTVSFWLRHPSS